MFIRTSVSEDYLPNGWQEHHFGLNHDQLMKISKGYYLVTGAGTGFGQAIAFGLAAAGAHVIISSRRDDKLDETRDYCADEGINVDNIKKLKLDLMSEQHIIDAVKELCEYTPKLSGVIHCAALPNAYDITRLACNSSWSDWSRLIGTNVRGIWSLTQQLLPLFQSNGSGRVIMLSSEAGWAGGYGAGLYNVSKAALNSLCQTMADEYKHEFPEIDMQVNTLVPGEARTEMNKGGKDSPFSVVNMALVLLAQNNNGPNGYFFHRDGIHFSFAYTKQYPTPLV